MLGISSVEKKCWEFYITCGFLSYRSQICRIQVSRQKFLFINCREQNIIAQYYIQICTLLGNHCTPWGFVHTCCGCNALVIYLLHSIALSFMPRGPFTMFGFQSCDFYRSSFAAQLSLNVPLVLYLESKALFH